jgi:hypothetical protein
VSRPHSKAKQWAHCSITSKWPTTALIGPRS